MLVLLHHGVPILAGGDVATLFFPLNLDTKRVDAMNLLCTLCPLIGYPRGDTGVGLSPLLGPRDGRGSCGHINLSLPLGPQSKGYAATFDFVPLFG